MKYRYQKSQTSASDAITSYGENDDFSNPDQGKNRTPGNFYSAQNRIEELPEGIFPSLTKF